MTGTPLLITYWGISLFVLFLFLLGDHLRSSQSLHTLAAVLRGHLSAPIYLCKWCKSITFTHGHIFFWMVHMVTFVGTHLYEVYKWSVMRPFSYENLHTWRGVEVLHASLIRRTLVQEMSLIGSEFRTYHCLLFLATPVGPKILIRNVKKNY